MEFSIEVNAILNLAVVEDDTAKHKGCDVELKLPSFFTKDKYYYKNGLPNRLGCKTITNVLVSALSANIHYAHHLGIIKDTEHLRAVMSELERQFVQVSTVYAVKKNAVSGQELEREIKDVNTIEHSYVRQECIYKHCPEPDDCKCNTRCKYPIINDNEEKN